MQLSPKAINEYQNLFKQEFGKELTYEQAEEQAMKLLRLIQIVYQSKELKGGEMHHGETNIQKTNTA